MKSLMTHQQWYSRQDVAVVDNALKTKLARTMWRVTFFYVYNDMSELPVLYQYLYWIYTSPQ